ncbi:MAG: hypothetical protein MK080_11050 [Opitutales bacterium]|nr:hypothetical protein [Opitutales bacterium]NRA28202.1 hypothetical protein [Opitutales bacterium]
MSDLHRSRLFIASCIALIVTAMSFAIRGGAMNTWTAEFGLGNAEVGWVNGTAFWGLPQRQSLPSACVSFGPPCWAT